ncbi:MAG: negative regulator of sigma E activity [Rhodothermales bacterium]|jgi:negative regulator of sigma E activity
MEWDTDMLIQQELDGENTSEDSTRLKDAMGVDAGLQARFDEFAQLTSAISKLPRAQPSVDFTAKVMAALPDPHRARVMTPSPVRAARSGASFLRSLVAPRMQLAYAAVAGALVAAAVTLSIGSVPNVESAAGTMSSVSDQPFQTIHIEGVSVTASQVDAQIILAFQGRAEIAFSWEGEAYEVSGVFWTGDVVTAIANRGQLSVSNAGVGEVRISLRPVSDSNIEIAVGETVATILLPIRE